jgi:hypothetical protein
MGEPGRLGGIENRFSSGGGNPVLAGKMRRP